uniref:Uncharacterized protein n=1 Tax=Podoviridae sp. ctiuS14 TaxID=2827620 RepID=A0A8S5LMJ6_9CAUD|nr:MAG TPA: hypothetical protein [Podoviridae sp. ctiuS14]
MTEKNIEKVHCATMVLNQLDNLLTSFVAKVREEEIPEEDLKAVLDEFPDFPEEILTILAQWSLETLTISLGLSGKLKDKE